MLDAAGAVELGGSGALVEGRRPVMETRSGMGEGGRWRGLGVGLPVGVGGL